MAMNSVPQFFALKSVYNNKYLRYLNGQGEVHKLLQFSGEEVLSPYVKFEAEKAKTGQGLVHLRCCFNNKYWVKSEANGYTSASAYEPEEDRSKASCTLFEPLFIDAKTLRFRHVQLGYYACLWRTAAPFTNCIATSYATTDGDKCDVYTVIDWESLMALPKYIAFKGDNGCYLSARMSNGYPHHQFASNDIGDPSVELEVFSTSDGSIRIKSNIFGKFWRRSPNWMYADSDDTTTNNLDTLFWPIKLDNNVFALRNMANNNFCVRLTLHGRIDCFAAHVSTITKEVQIKVEELVLSRKIYYVDFRLMDARIYNQNVITMAYGSADNKTKESKIVEIKLSYTETKSSTWNSSVSLKLGANSTTQSDIPVIGDDGKIKISDEFTGVYQWGKTESSTNIVGTVYHVTLPPMTTVRVSLLATKGSCNVPFSYIQRDILTNGEIVTYHMDDGVYTGINYFNYKFQIKEELLPKVEIMFDKKKELLPKVEM